MNVIGIAFEREFQFHPSRRWRFDFALEEHMIAIECEGGVWTGGRHNRGKGFTADCEKLSTAASMGWRVMRFTGDQVQSGWAIDTIERGIAYGLHLPG